MDFDHIDGDKVDNVGHMRYTAGGNKILEEIAKCEVVCANCHRQRTYARNRQLVVRQ